MSNKQACAFFKVLEAEQQQNKENREKNDDRKRKASMIDFPDDAPPEKHPRIWKVAENKQAQR